MNPDIIADIVIWHRDSEIVLELPHGCNKTMLTRPEALTLAQAIIERCGEWMPIEGGLMPVCTFVWVKGISGEVLLSYYTEDGWYDLPENFYPTHYQLIIQPKP